MNTAILTGNLTRDPELRYTPQGTAVCEFAIAINEKYKKGDQTVERVDFFEIVAWARTAEVCAEHLKKGRKVLVHGKLRQDRWESPEGKKMSKVRVTADRVEFMGAKPAGGNGQEDAPVEQAAATDEVPF